MKKAAALTQAFEYAIPEALSPGKGTKRRAFTCRAKPDGKNDLIAQALQENSLYYGLADITGLLDPEHTLESIRLAINGVHPEYKPLREAKMFWIFGRTMRPGDIVLTPSKLNKETVCYIGEVAGEAYHLEEMTSLSTSYRRPVRWHNDKLPLTKTQLSKELWNTINVVYNVRETCLDISAFAEELQAWIPPAQQVAPEQPIDRERFEATFDAALAKSLADDPGARAERLRAASPRPGRRLVSQVEFVRNPDVVAEVLARARGRCGRCHNPAPFERASDGSPYLEVHHVLPLARGGDDSVENAIALCPNCHRHMHYGRLD